MKKYRTSDTLTEGDIVEYGVDDIPYMAVRLDETKPCMEQCSMAYSKEHAFCPGFCYRWENGEDFVFVNAAIVGGLKEALDVKWGVPNAADFAATVVGGLVGVSLAIPMAL